MSKAISEKSVFLLIFLILFGGILASKQLGLWTEENEAKLVKYDAIDAYKPDDIRGSFSLAEVSKYYDIPVEALLKAFKYPLDADPEIIFGKNFEEHFFAYANEEQEIGNGSIKQFVALYNDLPYVFDESALFPFEALEVLSDHRLLDNETLNYLESHIVVVVEIDSNTLNASSTDEETIEEPSTEEEPAVKGATTFTQLISFGVEKSAIEKVIGVTIKKENQVIRDYCVENDLSFSEIKEALEALIK